MTKNKFSCILVHVFQSICEFRSLICHIQHTELLRWFCFSNSIENFPSENPDPRVHFKKTPPIVTSENYTMQFSPVPAAVPSLCITHDPQAVLVTIPKVNCKQLFSWPREGQVISLSRLHYRTSLLMHPFSSLIFYPGHISNQCH